MTTREYTQADYVTLCSWYDQWDLPRTPENFIPSTALVVDGVCAGFLYQLGNTSMFWVEGIVTNPKASKEDKQAGITSLLDGLTRLAKELKGEMILSSTPREGLVSLFKSNDFKEAPEKYNHLAKWI